MNVNVLFCASTLLLLTASVQITGQTRAAPPALTSSVPPLHAGLSASPDLMEGPRDEAPQQDRHLANRVESSAETTAGAQTGGTVPLEMDAGFKTHLVTTNPEVPLLQHTQSGTSSPSVESLSSMPTARDTTTSSTSATEGPAPPINRSLTTLSSQPAITEQKTASATPPQSEFMITAITRDTGHAQTSALGRGPAGTTHKDIPSELNVGDDEFKTPRRRSGSPLDPLLAALLSVFIVATAVVFIILFLKFRQRTNHPEFHRLQDLPMDDLMEDTPLSRYSY
ncbi:uncharacterized protein KZ484_021459 isoform 2-T2 [Pholidichthys leucotaenia]